MGADLRIEAVDHSDVAIARQLHAVQMVAYAQEARLLGAIYFPPLERTVEEVRTGAEAYLAAFIGADLAGAIGIGPDPEGLGMTIASLVVAPRFQRRGIGAALTATVIAAHGSGEISVQTGAKNFPALALYAQAGFVELRRWLVGREPLELVRMRRAPTDRSKEVTDMDDRSEMTIDEILKAGWDDHGERPQDVADRLAAALHLIEAPDQVAPFVQLLTHVYGEHLGLWQRGVALLETLRAVPAFGATAVASGPLIRSIATLRFAAGDAAALDALSAEDRVRALATASSAFAGRNELGRAIGAYAEALRHAETGLVAGSPAIRALAVGGNNLAAALEVKDDRSALETQAMVTAARAALDNWKLAGTWLEEERAHYRLARSLLQAGDAAAAEGSARQCVQVCERNDAPPFERFFGHAILALASRAKGNAEAFNSQRQAAMRQFAQLPEEERKWCGDECKELDAADVR